LRHKHFSVHLSAMQPMALKLLAYALFVPHCTGARLVKRGEKRSHQALFLNAGASAEEMCRFEGPECIAAADLHGYKQSSSPDCHIITYTYATSPPSLHSLLSFNWGPEKSTGMCDKIRYDGFNVVQIRWDVESTPEYALGSPSEAGCPDQSRRLSESECQDYAVKNSMYFVIGAGAGTPACMEYNSQYVFFNQRLSTEAPSAEHGTKPVCAKREWEA